MRKIGSSSGPHTQFTKSWEVAISRPIIVTKPTDAVREKHTVSLGSFTDDEFAIPSSLTHSLVSVAIVPSSSRMSVREIQGISPPHHSGCRRLGVWPEARRATSVRVDQRHLLGALRPTVEITTAGAVIC